MPLALVKCQNKRWVKSKSIDFWTFIFFSRLLTISADFVINQCALHLCVACFKIKYKKSASSSTNRIYHLYLYNILIKIHHRIIYTILKIAWARVFRIIFNITSSIQLLCDIEYTLPTLILLRKCEQIYISRQNAKVYDTSKYFEISIRY